MSDDNEQQTPEPEPEEAPDEPKLVYEVTIDRKGTPEGELIQIPGLGTFQNGSTFDVNKDQHELFRAQHSKQVMAQDDSGAWYVDHVEQGPTLLQASKGMAGVEVTTYAKGGGS